MLSQHVGFSAQCLAHMEGNASVEWPFVALAKFERFEVKAGHSIVAKFFQDGLMAKGQEIFRILPQGRNRHVKKQS